MTFQRNMMMGLMLASVVAVPAAMAEGTKHKVKSPTMVSSTMVSGTDVMGNDLRGSNADEANNPRNVERDTSGKSMTRGGGATGTNLRDGMPTSTKPGGASNP